MMEAVILAGGFGTRLQSVVNDVPKPMALVKNRPFLEYQLDFLEKYGVTHVVLSVGYLHDVIINHFGDNYKGMTLSYAVETSPLGTGGAIKFATKFLYDDVTFVLNGDSFFDVDLYKLYHFYVSNNADIVLSLKWLEDGSRYGNVVLDDMYRILEFHEKIDQTEGGFINGGIYIFNKIILNDYPEKFSFEKDFLSTNKQLKIMGLPFNGNFIDIGIPEDYYKIQTWNLR